MSSSHAGQAIPRQGEVHPDTARNHPVTSGLGSWWRQTTKGDAWGCVGRWFAGRWRTPPAVQYIGKVRQYLREKIWTTPDFQQP